MFLKNRILDLNKGKPDQSHSWSPWLFLAVSFSYYYFRDFFVFVLFCEQNKMACKKKKKDSFFLWNAKNRLDFFFFFQVVSFFSSGQPLTGLAPLNLSWDLATALKDAPGFIRQSALMGQKGRFLSDFFTFVLVTVCIWKMIKNHLGIILRS